MMGESDGRLGRCAARIARKERSDWAARSL